MRSSYLPATDDATFNFLSHESEMDASVAVISIVSLYPRVTSHDVVVWA